MAQDHSVFSNIQDNRTSSLAEQVADQINQVIIDQNINAGEKLPNEFELAARLNVGRGTIREAVKLLVARNCLEIRRGKGTFVAVLAGGAQDPHRGGPRPGRQGIPRLCGPLHPQQCDHRDHARDHL